MMLTKEAKRRRTPSRAQTTEALVRELATRLSTEFRRVGRETLRWLDRDGWLERLQGEAMVWRGSRGLPTGEARALEQKVVPEEFLASSQLVADLDAELRRADMGQERMSVVLAQTAGRAAEAGGNGALRSLGIKVAFNLRDPLLQEQIAQRVAFSAQWLGESTADDLRDLLVREFYEEGQHPFAVAKGVRGLFEETYKNRAKVIARTEIGASQSAVRFETLSRNGVTRKRWSASLDSKVREAHRALHGQEQDIDRPFQSMLGPIMHPHDPGASAANTINCRCDLLSVAFRQTGEPWTGGREET